MSKTNDFRVIGTRPIRPDGGDKLTGHAVFADDIHFPNMLHGKVARSPHAHARIKSIDVSAASALPGVYAIVTADDFPELEHEMLSHDEAGAVDIRDISDNCIARDKVLYDGHAVAAVAASNPHIAEEAVGLVKVDYEMLPPVMDVRSSMAEDATVIHENLLPGAFISPTENYLPNANRLQMGTGNIEEGFDAADIIIEREFDTATVHQGYIEGHITTVRWDSLDRITVWTATQAQFEMRDNLAKVLDIPIANITVIPLEIGGGFGGKDRIYADPLAAMLSKISGRPVKIAMRRDEVLRATGPTPGTFIRAKIGACSDGRLVAADVHMASEAGAYPGGTIFLGLITTVTRYNFPNIALDGFDVIVNKPKTRPYRAPGAPQALFATEQMIDELARKLELDPIDFRIKNLTQEGDQLVIGIPSTELDTLNMLETVRDHPHYTSPLEKPNQGRGFAYFYWFNLGCTSSVRIAVNKDGTVQLTTASPDLSGTRMTLAMQVAEVLGIDVADVAASVGDTDSIPYSFPSVGSRTTYATGVVACEAAEEILEKMAQRAALIWEIPPEKVLVDKGEFKDSSNPENCMSFQELATKLQETGGPISANISKAPDGMVPNIAAHLVDVEVDPETGKVDILRYTAFQDVGKAVHPDYVEGQIQGATVQGIGMALNEEYFYDAEGRLANSSLLDYRMPTALDVPMIETVILETPNPLHPFGVRGCGETSIAPPPAAIANAIFDAVGIRLNSMPMSPRKVSAAIAAKKKSMSNVD